MSQEEFDALMPNEFWREVVDRVAAEVPGTLLLAEAFWLLEGYFVRTLGMHRVYNSAFMNMMRDEENAKYRSYLKKTIEFDPDIMKRYVNFMSNPDERTAIDQFGDGDKYFGVCTLLATLRRDGSDCLRRRGARDGRAGGRRHGLSAQRLSRGCSGRGGAPRA